MPSWYVASGPGVDGPARDDDRGLELADLGKLARRGLRGVTRAARADEQVTFSSLLHGHLGAAAGGYVAEETWPGYEHVNVQAGLDAGLTAGGRNSETVGVLNFRHQHFGLASCSPRATSRTRSACGRATPRRYGPPGVGKTHTVRFWRAGCPAPPSSS